MENIRNQEDLKFAILELEIRQAEELRLLKLQINSTLEEMQPMTVIKNTFTAFTSSPDFTKKLISTAIGITTGYFSKSWLIGSTHNPIKKLLGGFMEVGIANFITSNQTLISTISTKIIQLFVKK